MNKTNKNAPLPEEPSAPVVNNPANFTSRILSSVVILAVLVGFFILRMVTDYAFDVFLGFLMLVSALEIENLMRKMDRPTYLVVIGGFPVLAFFLTIIAVNLGLNVLEYLLISIIALVVIFVLWFAVPLIFSKQTKKSMADDGYIGSLVYYTFSKSLNTIFVCIWPTLLMSFAFIINHFTAMQVAQDSYLVAYQSTTDLGLFGLVLLFVTTMFADTCAMLSGRLVKSSKISMQKLGPGKSWSGLVGGILGAMLGAIIVFVIFNSFSGYNSLFGVVGLNVWWMLLAGLFCGVLSMLGDIFSSFFKRRAGVKDYSQIIPGHGGIMDRINGLVVNSVAVFTVMAICFG